MYARVMTSTAKPDSIDAAATEWPHHIAAFKGRGLIAGYLFVDRKTRQFLSITIWESAAAQARNANSPEQIKGRAAFMEHLVAAPVPGVFEVVATVT